MVLKKKHRLSYITFFQEHRFQPYNQLSILMSLYLIVSNNRIGRTKTVNLFRSGKYNKLVINKKRNETRHQSVVAKAGNRRSLCQSCEGTGLSGTYRCTDCRQHDHLASADVIILIFCYIFCITKQQAQGLYN